MHTVSLARICSWVQDGIRQTITIRVARNGNEHVGGHGAPDLCLDRVLAGAQKPLDAQVLIDPLEIIARPASVFCTVVAMARAGKLVLFVKNTSV